MVQILTPRDRESFGSIIGRNFGAGLSSGADMVSKLMLGDIQSKKDFEKQKELLTHKADLEKNKLAKPLNELQQAQKTLAEQKSKLYEAKLSFLDRLQNKDNSEGLEESQADNLNLLGITKPEEFEEPKQRPKTKKTTTEKKSISALEDKPPHTDEDIQNAAIFDPTTANIWQKQNDAWLKQKQHEQKTGIEQKKYFNEASKKYREGLKEQATAAEKKNRALERQMHDVDKIGFYDRAVGAIFKGSPFEDLLKSDTAAKFDSNVLPQLEGQRQILGGILSDADIRLLLQKIVTSSKSPEANKYIAKWMRNENNLTIAKDRIADEIIEKNDGFAPYDFQSQIDKIYNERYGKDIQNMFDQVMQLPDDPKSLQSYRRKVPPGTKPDINIARQYLKMKGNVSDAMKLAEEDGYDISQYK